MEVALALLMAVVLVPVMVIVALVVWALDGRPVFFVQERMKSPTEAFRLIKFRTLTVSEDSDGVLGGDKLARVTRLGGFLRRSRLDEMPQILNVLRGDIGFVGPRPPLRRYVDRFPEIYGKVLAHRPGITGLATLMYHRREEALMRACTTTEEAEAVYERLCVPAKARLDLFYARHRNTCLDLRMMAATAWRRLPPLLRKRGGM